MERVNLALLSNALTATGAQLQRRLPDEELAQLAILVTQMADRYPSQDLEQSIEGYLSDFEQLAMQYGLPTIQASLAALRIKPGQKFFPRPDEVAEEIELQRERKRVPTAADTKARLAQYEADFWAWVKCRMQDEDTQGMTVQQFLDTVKAVGFVGRKESEMPHELRPL